MSQKVNGYTVKHVKQLCSGVKALRGLPSRVLGDRVPGSLLSCELLGHENLYQGGLGL